MDMLPKTSYDLDSDQPITPHEPINEIHVHKATMNQLFHPTSESRHFTRRDAATAFHHRMLPADDRVVMTVTDNVHDVADIFYSLEGVLEA